MTDDTQARAEAARLSELLAGAGLGGPPAPEPRDEEQVSAEIEAIVAAAPVRVAGTDCQDDTAAPLPAARCSRRRRWLVGIGAVAAVLLALTVVVLPHSGGTAQAVSAPPILAYPIDPAELAAGGGDPAGPTLEALSAAAAARTDPEPAGPVQHTLSQSWLLSVQADDSAVDMAMEPTVGETWVSPDGSAVFVQWRGDPLTGDGNLVPAVDTAPENASIDRMPAGTFDADATGALSRDPDQLRGELLDTLSSLGCAAADSPDTAVCLYSAITDLSDRLVLPADLTATLWRVLAEEPGITLAGQVTDRLGETAVALAFPAASWDSDPVLRVLLVDPGTGAVSGREEVTLSSELLGITEPTVTQFRYDVSTDWTAHTGPR